MIREKIGSPWTAQSVAIATLMALSVLFFYDPFSGISLTEWDRSFCSASLAGIDPSKRISSFYRLYLVYFPLLCGTFGIVVSALLKKRSVPHFGISTCLSFLALLVAYVFRNGPSVCHVVAIALAVACFAWQWILVFLICRKGNASETKRAGPVAKGIHWARENAHTLRVGFVYTSFAFSLLVSLPTLRSLLDASPVALINVGAVAVAGFFFVRLVARGGVRNMPAHLLDQACTVGAFSAILSVASCYSRIVVPLFAGHSVFFDEYARDFGAILFDSSASLLMTLSFLFALLSAEKFSGDIYRSLVSSVFASITLSLFLPLPVAVNALIVFILLLLLLRKGIDGTQRLEVLTWFPLIFCIACELFFTLFEKNMMPVAPAYGVYVLMALCLLPVFFKKARFGLLSRGLSENAFYAGALLSFVALAYGGVSYFQILHNNQVDFKDFYEFGNYLGVIDTMVRGNVPVIDYFSAHALSDVLTKIVHAAIHGNIIGALADPYGNFIRLSCGGIAMFFILAKFFHPFFAFSFVCLFPLDTTAFEFTDICLVAVLLHFWLYQKNSIAKFHLFWLLVALVAFYKYDTGVAFGIAAIVATIVLLVCRRDRRGLAWWALSGVSVSVLLLLFYFGYCHWNGIDAVTRMKEWISLTLHSNPYWAEESLFHSMNSPLFVIVYFAIPLAESFVIYYVLVESFRKRDMEKTAALSLLFSVVGLFMLTRSFVYYTLTSTMGRGRVIFCYSVFALLFFVLHLLQKKKMETSLTGMSWLAVVAVAIGLCNGVNHFFPDVTNVSLNRAVSGVVSVRENLQRTYPKAERYGMDGTLQHYSDAFGAIFGNLLENRETFLDFADIPLVYALTGKDKPFYSAQSPGLLTDLYSQEMFLKEIREHEVPVAVTALTNRGFLQTIAKIPHHVRFYRIAEYLYAHYRPLARFEDFMIWCRPDRYDVYARKLESVQGVSLELAEYGYFPNSEYHYFDLKWNPYIWANLDKEHAAANTVLEDARREGDLFVFSGSNHHLHGMGNYIAMDIESAADSAAANIRLFESERPDSQYGYAFKLKKGRHQYLIRSSQDYNWYAMNINTIRLDCEGCVVNRMQILQGD